MMNFGSLGMAELVVMLLIWAIPILLMWWFIRTLTSMAAAQRDIAARLAGIEEQLRRGASL